MITAATPNAMFSVICDNQLTESVTNGEMFLRATIVETAEGLESAKGLRCQMWLEQNPEIVDFPGKGVNIEATPAGSFQIEGTPIVGLRLTDIKLVTEMDAETVAGYKTAIAKTRLDNLLANPNQVANNRRAPKVDLAEAAAKGEVAPVATGADL